MPNFFSILSKRLSLMVYSVVISIVSLSPATSVSKGYFGINFLHIDKVAHFLAYFIFGFIIHLNYPNGKQRRHAFLTGVAYGIFLEFCQFFISGRSMSFLDMLANSLGLFIGFLLLRESQQQSDLFEEID